MRTELRRSYRYPVPPDKQQGTLSVRGNDVTVRLVDESMGGISVHTPDNIRVRVGDEAHLVASSLSLQVRVCSVVREDNGTRIGLQRLREVPVDDSSTCDKDKHILVWLRDKMQAGELTDLITVSNILLMLRTFWNFSLNLVKKHFRKHANKWIVGVVMLLLVTVCGTFYWLSRQDDDKMADSLRLRGLLILIMDDDLDTLNANERQHGEIQRVLNQTLDALDRLLQEELDDRSFADAATQINAVLTPDESDNWNQMRGVRQLSGPYSDSLGLRELVDVAFGEVPEKLGLDEEQNNAIRSVTVQLIDTLDRRWQAEELDAVSTKAVGLLTNADLQVATILTEEQRERWELLRQEYNQGALLSQNL